MKVFFQGSLTVQALVYLLLLLPLAACSDTADSQPTATAVPIAETTRTLTPEPTLTNTLEPTATETQTAEPTATTTLTPTSTATGTPTSRPTNTPVPTETPTNTLPPPPTIPPATNTPTPPPAPPAPLYPNTPIQPWDQNVFHSSIVLAEKNIADIQYYLPAPGSHCSIIWGEYGALEALPGFTGVPPEWQSRYVEYRQILHEARIAIIPITDQCVEVDDMIYLLSGEQEQAIVDTLGNLRARAQQLLGSI